MAYVAVLIDPKDSDHPEVFGPHVNQQAATWAAEDVLAQRFPLEWANTREYVPDPVDATADQVINAWNEIASRANYLPYLRVIQMNNLRGT